MTEFNRQQLNTLRKQMQNSLSMFANKTDDLTIEVGNCSYNGGEATFKVKVLLKGAKTREQLDLEFYAELHKLDLTAVEKLMGEDMQLSGYKARARKKPWILKRLRDGAEFVADTNLVEKFFKKREEIHAE